MSEEDGLSEEETANLQEAFETVILYLVHNGYSKEQIMEMGPLEAYEVASLEYSLTVTED